jgi:hypothetical protein
MEDSKEVVTLTHGDCKNLLDALLEWDEEVGPKELEDYEAGLNYDRYMDMLEKLKQGI